MNNAAASVQVRCDRTMASVAVHTFHTFDRKLPAARQNRAKTQFGAVDLSGIRGCAYRAPSITSRLGTTLAAKERSEENVTQSWDCRHYV